MSEYIYATDSNEGHWLTGEEIVRCRDCKSFANTWISGDPDWCSLHCIKTKVDNFCAWGERRDAE